MNDEILALIAEGVAERHAGRIQAALDAFVRAVALSRKGQDLALLAEALTALGYAERSLLRGDAALEHYQAAAELYRSLDDPLRLAHTVRHVADILCNEGRLEESEQSYEEALRIYREHGEASSLDVANALRGYALLKEDRGEIAATKGLWEEAGIRYKLVGVEAGVKESERKLRVFGDP